MTRQPELPRFSAPRYKRPTMTVDAAKGILDLTEDDVRALVDTGALVAWSISTPGAERPELRILTASVAEFLRDNTDGSPDFASTIQPATAIAALVPKHDKPFLTGPEVKRTLNCGRQHLTNLVDANALAQLPGTQYRRGPKGWPVISRDSFIAFLRTRMIGAM